jgi:hypothetical protein
MLLVYLYETFPPEMTKSMLISTWNIIKYNLVKSKTNFLLQVTCQMIAVLLWKHISDFLQVIIK